MQGTGPAQSVTQMEENTSMFRGEKRLFQPNTLSWHCDRHGRGMSGVVGMGYLGDSSFHGGQRPGALYSLFLVVFPESCSF